MEVTLHSRTAHSTGEWERWGPPLGDYLGRLEANLEFPELPPEDTVCAAIGRLMHNPRDVTFKTLESIMSLLYRPRMLPLIVHENAVDSCMDLLETYVTRNGWGSNLFEHAFGFLTLHVLSLVLQAGLLYYGGFLIYFAQVSTEGTDWVWDVRAPALHPDFVLLLFDYITREALGPTGGRSVTDYRIEWREGSHGDERACLPVIGGFRYRHAGFVLRQLFMHRGMFLECCFRTRAPGWSILIYVIQCLLDDRSWQYQRDAELWEKQFHIVHRYALVSRSMEDTFFEEISGRFIGRRAMSSGTGVINFADARLIHLAFIRKFHPNHDGARNKRDLSYETTLAFYTLTSLANHLPLELTLGETAFEIVWDALSRVTQETDAQWADMDIFLIVSYGIFLHVFPHR
ncbi:hypothetical protein FS749_006134 [Ceratobasidium sp. UAMH 11750]|nr:hypothetical protein FS749_006134 [Ceratobasidium sp. UAMH 11750]